MNEADAALRIGRVAPLQALFLDSVRPRRFLAWLFGSFALATLCVVFTGIFGQLAIVAARRRREIGIRMACGATRFGVVREIMAGQLVPVAVGLSAGGVMAGWTVGLLRGYTYQVDVFEPRLWAAAASLMLVTVVTGVAVPALRGSQVDLADLLKSE
jgi:ABC-type antimicrobial peptide transport system permease subunit